MLLTRNLEATSKYLEERCKLFNIHSFINFTAGFELTNKSYDRFVQNKPLSVGNYEKQIDALYDTFIIDVDLSSTELRTRKHLLHSISTVHLMENFVNNVELVDEKEREKARLHPKTGQGINKRMLANVEVDAIRWMKAKMEVRKF